MSINAYVSFFASPKDTETIFRECLMLLCEQFISTKRAAIYCEKMADFKENSEKAGFYTIANEYYQLKEAMKKEIEQLLSRVE